MGQAAGCLPVKEHAEAAGEEALTSGFSGSCALLAKTKISSREQLGKRQG